MANNEVTLVLKAKDLATIEVRRVTEELRRASRESIENTKSANRIAQDSARSTARIQIDAARSAQRVIEQNARATAIAARQAEGAFLGANRAVVDFVAGYASIQGLRSLVGITDQYANLQSKIRIATDTQQEFIAANVRTYEVAQRTFTSLEDTVILYARLSSSLDKYGVSQNRVVGLTETINKTLAISGATTAETSSAITQLSQALGAGALRGQEFVSVNEAAPLLMQKLADALGVTRGELKGLADDGRLTTQVVVAALEEQAQSISATFEEVPLTTTRALTQMQNAATVAFGQLFGDGNRALAEFISFFVSGVEQLPVTVEVVTQQIIEFFRLTWQSVLTGVALLDPGTRAVWIAVKGGAEDAANSIRLYFANVLDDVIQDFAGAIGEIGQALSFAGSVLGGPLQELSAQLAQSATFTRETTNAIELSSAARRAEADAVQAEIQAILKKDQAARTEIQSLALAYAASREAEAAARAAALATEDEAEGRRKTAKELLAETAATGKNTEAKRANARASKTALDIELEMLETRNRLIKAEESETKAKDQARATLEGIIPAIEKAYALDGLTIEQRRIAEAGIKAEQFAREKLQKVIQGGIPLSEAEQAAIRAEAKARGEVLEAARIKTEDANEANKRAAEEYRRQWEQAFDSVVDAALQGGDALKSAVFRYLRDIQAEFAKKIILNIVTRYSSEGKKGKAGQSDDDEEPTLFEQGVQFAAGAAGVRDAYRNGGGAGGALSGAVSGYQAGSVFGPVGGIIGAIVGGIAGLIGGPKPPDLRLGASGVTRKPEQSFNTVFGAQQIGVRGGTDTARFIELVTEFDKTISGIVGNFENGQDQLDAIKNRLRTWSVDLKGDAITTEAVLGSRFNAILSTFNADIQAFVGTLGTTEERAQRLQDAAFIQGATKGSILANTFNDLARILGDNAKNGESVAQTYERVSAAVETLRAALAISGVQLTQTGDVFIRFAADIATAAGGTQQAAELWNTYFETFYTAEERAASAVEVANQRRLDALNAIGLEATISAEQFRATFEAALPTLTPEQVVAYLQAGTAIARAAAAQDAYNEVLDEAGALTAQAQAAAEALNQVEQSLAQIEQRIDAGFTELARSGFTDFERGLLSINDTLGATTRELLNQRSAAELAGASAQTLARFDLALGRAQLLAASQAAAAIDRLRKAARSLIDQLYGTGVQEVADAGAAAFEQIGQAAQNMYESQLNSIKTIQDYLDAQLLGQNSSLTPSERFEEAQRQFFAAIASGNAQESVRLADVLLNLGRERFASSQPFNDLEAAVRAALQGLIGTIGTPVAPTGTGFGSTGTPQEFDQSARENRLELALQLSEIVRELLLATGDSLSTVAESIGLNMTQLVTDLGVNLGNLSVATTSSLGAIAQQIGVELTDLAQNVGVDLGRLSTDQSLINAALEAEIKKLPKDQRDKLQPLLDAVEEAARVGGPDAINTAIEALEDETRAIGGATARALEPYLDGIDPTDPLLDIDAGIRELWRPGSYLDQINANIAELLRITTLPQPEAPAAVIATTTTPGRAQASTITIVPDNTALISEIKKTNERLVALENTVRNGDRANVNATNTAAAVVANSSEKIASKPKLVMSEYA